MSDTQTSTEPKVSVPAQAAKESPVDTSAQAAALQEPDVAIGEHGFAMRGLQRLPSSPIFSGRFGRMFRNLEPFLPDLQLIDRLAREVAEPNPEGGEHEDRSVPAGYTFLGQFIDHDLTFDPTSSFQRHNDPDALVNFRSPRFDLDCLYGRGPADQPYLYARDSGGERFRIASRDGTLDLPRDEQGLALIGDPRNDENLIISHVQLTMLALHNQTVDWLSLPGNQEHIHADEDVFTAAQRLVRWHYQWVVLHDFLPRIVDPDIVADVVVREPLVPGGEPADQVRLGFFHWREAPFMPVEFSVAAYRFGHSTVRSSYTLNSRVGSKPIFTEQPAQQFPHAHLGGFRPLPEGWQIDWARFFPTSEGSDQLQFNRKIDRFLAPPLLDLPPDQAKGISNLAKRNLLRGARLGLPSGQDVARTLGVRPLVADDLPDPAPLWYYILREAEPKSRLGPVGGRIVAEVFAGLLHDDPSSYLCNAPAWRPVFDAAQPGEFTMTDLVNFAGVGVAEQPAQRS
ncbi:peroxidase family protein [Salinactinospora qingdaonensis]|uniref:Heme peroxidase family protein n=1 Tax=Salinactinospora qingdaonensis TaxID=702744 RepID=A0ABP7F4G8_9ACTN